MKLNTGKASAAAVKEYQKVRNLFFALPIRSKLSVFVGFFIIITVSVILLINLDQQKRILNEGYEREASVSRKFISSYLLEIEGISRNLIHAEQFRSRVARQTEALRIYKAVESRTEQKKVKVFGMNTSLFGALGKERVTIVRDTYFSKYLSPGDIAELERRVRLQLQSATDEKAGTQAYNKLRGIAAEYVKAEWVYTEILGNAPPENSADAVRNDFQKKLEEAAGEMHAARSRLNTVTAAVISQSAKARISEAGLDTGRFRIQSFPARFKAAPVYEPALDTSVFDPEAKLNSIPDSPETSEDLKRMALLFSQNPWSAAEASETEAEYGGMSLQILYNPHYKYPVSSFKAELLNQARKEGNSELKKFLDADAAVSAELSQVALAVSERLKILKKESVNTPPGQDEKFINLYKKYHSLAEQREEALKKFKQEAEEKYTDLAEAAGSLRDSALEEQIILWYGQTTRPADESLLTGEKQQKNRDARKALRNWIYSGSSETPPESLKAWYPDGIISLSRSEAEELLWRLDTLPLLSEPGNDAVSFVLSEGLSAVIRTIIDRSPGVEAVSHNRNRSLLTALFIAFISVAAAFYAAGFVIQKIRKIISSAEQVGKGDLKIEFEYGGADEFGHLTDALNSMVSGLRDREKIKGILGSMVDPVVIGEAMKDLTALKNGKVTDITAFFSDIAGFSTISEKLSSKELAALLNEYLSAMTLILKEHEGVLDKYIGDAIVGIFNAPVPVNDHTLKAVKASLRMHERLRELKAVWTQENRYIPEARTMTFRVGLNTGPAKVGFMGTDALASYTMMGDTVNLASRLEAAGKDYGVSLLVSEAVYNQVKNHVFARKMDLIRVKGKNEPVTIYEIISDTDELPRGVKDSAALYEQGLNQYLLRDWGGAIHTFHESEKIRGREDKAVRLLIARIEHFRKSPPPEDWDGAFTRDHK